LRKQLQKLLEIVELQENRLINNRKIIIRNLEFMHITK